MEKIIRERPPNRKIKLYCVKCKSSTEYFMTNQEIFNKTKTEQFCKVCNKITKYMPL